MFSGLSQILLFITLLSKNFKNSLKLCFYLLKLFLSIVLQISVISKIRWDFVFFHMDLTSAK